jgi:hypothetical protein
MALNDAAPRIPAEHIRAAFAARGILALHYAASVEDACRFLRAGALLSTGDVFLDAADIHATLKRQNKCGPVMFVIETAILATPAARDAGVCKCMPGDAASASWFADAEEVMRDFAVLRHDQMLVLHAGGRLPFGGHLLHVIVDAVCAGALPALWQAALEGGVGAIVEQRACAPDCGCAAESAL